MTVPAATDTDVVIVGAGPTGLLIAGDLANAGVRTTIVERRTDRSTLTRAFGVHARTLEESDARGVADGLLASGARVRELRLFDRVHLDLGSLPSRYPFLLVTPQHRVERVLRTRAEQAGVTFRSGATVTGLHQDTHGVHADLADGSAIDAAPHIAATTGSAYR